MLALLAELAGLRVALGFSSVVMPRVSIQTESPAYTAQFCWAGAVSPEPYSSAGSGVTILSARARSLTLLLLVRMWCAFMVAVKSTDNWVNCVYTESAIMGQ